MDPVTGSIIGGVVGKVLDLVRVKVGDPIAMKELENDALAIATQAETDQMKVDQQRLATVQSMLRNKSLFVSGAIPAYLWVVPLTVVFNCWIMPLLNFIGAMFLEPGAWTRISPVWLPTAYLTIVGVIITGLFGKKVVDNNAFFGKDGRLMSPPKQLVDSMILQAEQKGDNVELRFKQLMENYKKEGGN